MSNKYKEYIKTSDKYIKDGEERVLKGDLLQAGRKYWRAAAQLVRAIAVKHNWPHNGHADLFKVVDRLGDIEIDKLFRAANRLHQNFYEHWLTESQIQRDIEETKNFCIKLKERLNG